MRGVACALLLLLFAGCAPAVGDLGTVPLAPQDADGIEFAPAGSEVLAELLSPFRADLAALGIEVTSGAAYAYEGADPNGFVVAINEFYRRNPGYCPLTEAFYAAPDGLRFMTVTGDGGTSVRAFLYDQARRPRLRFAYLEGTSQRPLSAVQCRTPT